MAKASPFDFAKAVTERNDPVARGELDVNEMNVFMVCRALGHRGDAIGGVSMVNEMPGLSRAAAYRVLRSTVPKSRSNERWAKASKVDGIDVVKSYFGVGDAKALEIMETVGPSILEKISAAEGGTEKRTKKK